MSREPHRSPSPPEIDHAAEMRQAHWEALKARIPWDLVLNEWQAQIRARLLAEHHPLGEHWRDLQHWPLEDAFELDSWLQGISGHDRRNFGRAVLRLLGEAQLHIMAQLDERPF